MSGDHVELLEAVLKHVLSGRRHAVAADALDFEDLRAALDELKQLRGDVTALLEGNQRLQTQNEGLRQLAIEAREAANGWHQATIDLYSAGSVPQPQDGAVQLAHIAELEAENARLRDDSSERALVERNEQLRDGRDTARAEVARAWEDLTATREERDRLAAENTRLRAECDEAAPTLPDPRGPEHRRVATDWHTVSATSHKSWTDDGYEWNHEYDIDHPDECDLLPYGQECLFDRHVTLFGLHDGELGFGPRKARAHAYGPDMNGDFEEHIEWGKDVESAHPESTGEAL